MLTIRQLRYFEALARFGHFGHAAEHCSVTQPALSMQIAELEQKLGVTLVERLAKGVALTEAGQEIAKRASRILLELRDIEDCAAGWQAPLSKRIRFGVIPTVAPYLLPALLMTARQRHPRLAIQIREAQTRVLVNELLTGSLDLLMLALPLEGGDIETLEIAVDRFLLAVPSHRRFGSRVRAKPELFRNERLLLLEEGHCLRDQALAICDLQPSETTDTLGVSSLSTIVQMVTNNLGLTLLPEISIPHETAHGNIKLIRFAAPEPSRLLGLAWRKSSPRRADYLEFAHLVREAISRSASSREVRTVEPAERP